MVDREKQSLFRQVREEANQIAASAGDFAVLTLGNVIDSHMDFGAAWHPASNLFADEEIPVLPQFFGAGNGVVVC